MINIEAVTVCVNYADFLAAIAPFNIPLLSRWIIVTSDTDHATREVCRRFGLECVISEEHLRPANGGGQTEQPTFNKGRLVERGLQHLNAKGWRLHLDADIVLPFQMRQLLDAAHLDEQKIYGCDRLMLQNWDQWQAFTRSGWLNHDYHHRVMFPDGIKIGARWAHTQGGYCPIGFFQLWHSDQDEWRGIRTRPYPISSSTACRTDVQHALQWDRRQRELLPELIVAHLESEACPMGTNWNGRKTRQFGPQPGIAATIQRSPS